MEKIMLIDGNSIANRAFFGVPLLTNSHGEYTNAVYGFFNILFNSYQQPKVPHNIEHTSPPIPIFIIAWLYHLICHIS